MSTLGGSVASGIAVLLAGNLLWGMVLAPMSIRVGTAVPWAIVPMTAYLWAYWRVISGATGPRENAGWRRERLRANPVPADQWPLAIVAGLSGFAALLAFVDVMGRLVPLPASGGSAPPTGMPSATVFMLLVMGSVVAGVTEEAAFRGYMQTPLERRFGLGAAILISGTMFGLLHFPNHPRDVLTMLPYYIAVSAVYGGITSAVNSILPALVLHAGGDVWSLTRLWLTGTPEWQTTTAAPTQLWQAGADVRFVAAVLASIVFSVVTWWCCRLLRGVTHS